MPVTYSMGARHTTEKAAIQVYNKIVKSVKWMRLYEAAIQNMPEFEKQITYDSWVQLPKNTVLLPDFILSRAKAEMEIRNGKVYKRTQVTKMVKAAKQATLARLLGYTYKDRTTGNIKVNSMSFTNIIHSGVCPRDPEKQKLILRLASKEGPALAKKLLHL